MFQYWNPSINWLIYVTPSSTQFFILIFKNYIIPIYFPSPIDLYVLNASDLRIEFLNTKPCSKLQKRSHPLIVCGNHAHIPHNYTSFTCSFIKALLIRFHHHFIHHSTGQCLNLLKQASQSEVYQNMLNSLEPISISCNSCSASSLLPFHFQGTIPKDQIMFNREFYIHLMWLEFKPALHTVEYFCHVSKCSLPLHKWRDDQLFFQIISELCTKLRILTSILR